MIYASTVGIILWMPDKGVYSNPLKDLPCYNVFEEQIPIFHKILINS